MTSDVLPVALARELSKRYEIQSELGHGGMGRVFLAEDRMLGRRVAIKLLRTNIEESEHAELSERFLREARTAARLQHPGIVALYEFGEVDETRYFIMQHVDGESLESRLRPGPLNEDESAAILADIADALASAHAQKVVHRDIKPSNILLARDTGRAMVADFGIAKSDSGDGALTATQSPIGTPVYMSPEQWAVDKNIDGRSDIYSLGVMAYEMVVGSPPFASASWPKLMNQHCNETPEAMGKRTPTVSSAYSALVMRCLEKDRDARWQSAADLGAALRVLGKEDPDPAALQPLRHVAAYGALGALAMGTWGTVPISATTPDDMPLFALVVLWAVVTAVPLLWSALVFFGRMRASKGEPIRWRDALAVGMRVPVWWHAWWPRRWLSSLDRSNELPRRVKKAARWFVGASTAVVILIAVVGFATNAQLSLSEDEWRHVQSTHEWHVIAAFSYRWLPLFVAAILLGFVISWWRARRDITASQAKQLFERMRTPGLWREPWIRQMITKATAENAHSASSTITQKLPK